MNSKFFTHATTANDTILAIVFLARYLGQILIHLYV